MPFLHDHKKDKFNSNKYVNLNPKNGFNSILTKKQWLYEGNLLNNWRHYFGVLSKKLANKSYNPKYRGNWHTDKRHGEGNGYYLDGGYYVGQWRCGRRWGYGMMWYTDGSFYDGDWYMDKRDGLGLFVQINGNRYEGEWYQNKKHGMGRFLHLTTGQMQEGLWHNGEAICSTIEDIPFRQTGYFCTEYCIRPITLVDYKTVLSTNQELVRKEDSNLCFDVEILEHSENN